jgi:hypothetical protein
VRYSKAALLLFGGGMLLGLLVVAADLRWLARVASGIMGLSLLALPIAVIADLRHRLAVPRATTRSRPNRRQGRRNRGRRSAGPRR